MGYYLYLIFVYIGAYNPLYSKKECSYCVKFPIAVNGVPFIRYHVPAHDLVRAVIREIELR